MSRHLTIDQRIILGAMPLGEPMTTRQLMRATAGSCAAISQMLARLEDYIERLPGKPARFVRHKDLPAPREDVRQYIVRTVTPMTSTAALPPPVSLKREPWEVGA